MVKHASDSIGGDDSSKKRLVESAGVLDELKEGLNVKEVVSVGQVADNNVKVVVAGEKESGGDGRSEGRRLG